ncbi:N-acetylglucosaminyl transferase component-domain-containing protein [Paraphysoderma sedebokerense]|nr:N-acetylglucosaminyl transferase component-domain-containing protein [Paraphysoderma sedebokerense]
MKPFARKRKVNHLHTRLSQMFYSWPAQVSCLMQSSPDLDQSDENTQRLRNDNDSELYTEQLKNRATQYINFYNSMWLVLNDVIIGIAIGSILYDNAQEISEWVNWTIEYYTVTHIKSMINWLMSWPAGLKLNNNLVTFLGDLFLWLIYLWNFLLTPLLASTFGLLRLISLTGYFGSTFIISLLIDLLSIGVIHITWFYIIAKRLTFWMWKAGRGLGLLFQGKKYNPLRDRYDSADYDLDQLLVGTILFTLLIFLAPTMVCYFLVFWSIRVPIMILHKFCTFLIQYLNTFPLFSVMLRIKDPDRVVGGVEFELAYSKSSSQKEAYLRMKNTPPSIISILTRNPKI